MSFFTPLPSFYTVASASRAHATRSGGAVQTNRVPLATTDRHLPPAPRRSRRERTPARALGPIRAGNGPGLIEYAVERERRGAAHGGTVAERRREHLEGAGPGRERALLERPPDVGDEPGRERPEAATQHHGLDVEHVEGRREGDAQPAAGVGERPQDAGGAALGAADDLVREAPRTARRRRDTGRARNRLLADERLDAAAAPARATGPRRGRPTRGRTRRRTRASPGRGGRRARRRRPRRPRRRRRRSRRSRPRRRSSAPRARRGSTRSRRGPAARASPRARPRPAGRTTRGSGRSTTVPDASSTSPGTATDDADRPQALALRPRRAPPAPSWRGGRAPARARSRGCRGTRGARSERRRSGPRPRTAR